MDDKEWLKFWATKKDLLLDLLDECEISLREILKPPEKQDQTAIYFCPFCMSEYSQKQHHCIDCEMVLIEFNEEKKEISLVPSLAEQKKRHAY